MPGCLADGCGWLPEGKVLSLTHDLRGAIHFLLQGPKIWLVVRLEPHLIGFQQVWCEWSSRL